MTDYVAGRIPVLACLEARKRAPRKLYLLESGRGLEPIRQAAQGIPIETCPRRDLDERAQGLVHQGVVLEAAPLPVHNADAWIRAESLPAQALIVVLDGVEDPHNFGAIVRSAAAFGAQAVLFGKDRAAPVSPAAVKSAAGGMEYVDLVRAANLVRALEALKQHQVWVAGLDADGATPLSAVDFEGRWAVVIGSEGRGMHRLTRQACDWVVHIPMPGPLSSLNASVSAGIALAAYAGRLPQCPA